MKRLVSLIISAAIFLSLSVPVMAAEPTGTADVGTRIGYMDFDVDALAGEQGIMPRATTNSTVSADTVDAHLLNGATGTVESTSVLVKFSGMPSTAKIKDLQAWCPNKNYVTQSRFTTIQDILISRDEVKKAPIKFWVLSEPTMTTPCNTTAFNAKNPNGTYELSIRGNVYSNESDMDGFQVIGTKIRVTYTY